jgi:hypothetical protein
MDLLDPDAVVSMNLWGFQPAIFEEFESYFHAFLREVGDDIKRECLLPSMIGELLDKDKLQVKVLSSADRWFGMTYHEDRQTVSEELQKLHDAGVYPPTLKLG